MVTWWLRCWNQNSEVSESTTRLPLFQQKKRQKHFNNGKHEETDEINALKIETTRDARLTTLQQEKHGMTETQKKQNISHTRQSHIKQQDVSLFSCYFYHLSRNYKTRNEGFSTKGISFNK